MADGPFGLPIETLRRDGVHFCNIRCWVDALVSDEGRVKGKLLIKYDPRELSRMKGTQQTDDQLRPVAAMVPAVTELRQRTAAAFQVGGGDVV